MSRLAYVALRTWLLTVTSPRSRVGCLAQPIHAERDVHAMETVLGQHTCRGVRARDSALERYGEPYIHISCDWQENRNSAGLPCHFNLCIVSVIMTSVERYGLTHGFVIMACDV